MLTVSAVKGSENTAWSSDYFVSTIKGALAACGHNPDLVQVSLNQSLDGVTLTKIE